MTVNPPAPLRQRGAANRVLDEHEGAILEEARIGRTPKPLSVRTLKNWPFYPLDQ